MLNLAAERDISISTLANGIRVITEPMPAVRSVAAGVWIGTGSRSESPAENGISHFIEHMVFKGTPGRSAEDIAREMDSLGGHLDAFTGRELVGFNVKVLDEHVPAALDVLADMLRNPKFQAEDIEKEKSVILEELKMETDNPESLVHDLFVRNFWIRHPLGQPILGSRKTINSFNSEVLARYHREFYSPANMTITAAGNLEHAKFLDQVDRLFGGMPAGGREVQHVPPAPGAPIILKNRRSLQQVQVCLGMPIHPATHPLRFACYTLNVILGGGMSSRLFQNIRERQGLAYAIFTELHSYMDAGTFLISAGTSPEKLNALLDSALAELRRLKEEPVAADELHRAKEYMKGSLLLSLESTSSRMGNLARQWLNHRRFFSLDEIAASIDAVTSEQVQEIATEFFQPERMGLSLLGRLEGIAVDRGRLAC